MNKIPNSARENQFKYFPNLDNEIKELEQDYKNYCFVPLDIPLIKDDNFASWYFEKALPINSLNFTSKRLTNLPLLEIQLET